MKLMELRLELVFAEGRIQWILSLTSPLRRGSDVVVFNVINTVVKLCVVIRFILSVDLNQLATKLEYFFRCE